MLITRDQKSKIKDQRNGIPLKRDDILDKKYVAARQHLIFSF
jgi:hypothetical protein